MSEPILMLLAAGIGYLIGSVPFGLIFARLGGKGDIRDIGSGSTGATNVLRSGSKFLALATLLADMAKGGLAVGLLWRLGNDHAAYLAGVAALVGHLFPVWVGFKGGKGATVFAGAMLIMSPLTGILFPLIWILLAVIFRKSSVATIISLLASLAILAFLGEMDTVRYATLMVVLSLWAHRENISRLRAGTEPKIGQS